MPDTFFPLVTRVGDRFAAELRQTCQTLLTYAANPQISALLEGEDAVFLNQAFPPPATLAAPGWASLRDLLSEDAHIGGAAQAAEYAATQSVTTLRWNAAPTSETADTAHRLLSL